MDKQQLASKIWSAANSMRGSLDANDYKDLILGLLFYKYLSDREIEYFINKGLPAGQLENYLTFGNEQGPNNNQKQLKNLAKDELGYFIAYPDLFSSWLDKIREIKTSTINEALQDFDANVEKRHVRIFDKVFNPLAEALPKLGSDATSQAKKIRDLITIVKDIPTTGKSSYDVLGFIYEYLIANFAANAGKSAGEFYTPHEVALVMAEIVAHHLQGRNDIQVYDPTSGSASLLLNIGEAITRRNGNRNNIQYYAQELKTDAYALTRMNLVMRGVHPNNIITREGDSLAADWPMIDDFGNYSLLHVDAVVSNPPYSAEWDRPLPGADKRFAYGLAPAKKADYAFLLHELYHLKEDGILAIVLPHGVLFRGGEEGSIRTNLIERNHVEAIIGLPANIFYGTGIATIIMVLKKERGTDDSVLFIDASKGFIKAGKKNELRPRDIRKIVDTVIERRSENKYSRMVSRDEIRNNGYNLNIPRYVDSSEDTQVFDIYATMFGGLPQHEINALASYWRALPGLRERIFESATGEHTSLREGLQDLSALNSTIRGHESVIAFKDSFAAAFVDLDGQLEAWLIDDVEAIDMTTIEADIRKDIFSRLSSVPIVDIYEVYELFASHWAGIELDLEMLRNQGWETVRKVEPNMVTKTEKGKGVSKQDGWIGAILPFELVQQELLAEDFEELNALRDALATAEARCDELLESLDEEQRAPITNDAGDKFTAAAVKTELNKLLAEVTSPEIEALEQYSILTAQKRKKEFETTHPEVNWQELPHNKQGIISKKNITARITELRSQTDFDEDAFERVLLEVQTLLANISTAKKNIKAHETKIHRDTKTLIENLDDETARKLLRVKWVDRMLTDIAHVPDECIDNLVDAVAALDAKYATTLSDIGRQVHESEQALAGMMSKLTGTEKDMAGIAELAKILGGNND